MDQTVSHFRFFKILDTNIIYPNLSSNFSFIYHVCITDYDFYVMSKRTKTNKKQIQEKKNVYTERGDMVEMKKQNDAVGRSWSRGKSYKT